MTREEAKRKMAEVLGADYWNTTTGDDWVSVIVYGVSFAQMEALSIAFGTKLIDTSVEPGYSTGPDETVLTVRGITLTE